MTLPTIMSTIGSGLLSSKDLMSQSRGFTLKLSLVWGTVTCFQGWPCLARKPFHCIIKKRTTLIQPKGHSIQWWKPLKLTPSNSLIELLRMKEDSHPTVKSSSILRFDQFLLRRREFTLHSEIKEPVCLSSPSRSTTLLVLESCPEWQSFLRLQLDKSWHPLLLLMELV